MKANSKYESALQPLLFLPSFTIAEAETAGVPRRMIAYFVEKGDLERIGRGIYRSTSYSWGGDLRYEELVIATTSVRSGVICLISALAYYDLTDEIAREHWIAIPNSQWAGKTLPHVRIVRMRNITLGLRKIRIGGREIAIFDRERCVIDAFRYLSIEIALKALKAYLYETSARPDVQKIAQYAKTLRVNIDPYLIALTT